MVDLIYQVYYYFHALFHQGHAFAYMLIFFPFVLLLEIPFVFIMILGSIRQWLKEESLYYFKIPYYPMVTCVICAYSEKEGVCMSIESLLEQRYHGKIEILVIFDGAKQNKETVDVVKHFMADRAVPDNIEVKLIEKKSRGGHASSMNLGLSLARGEVLIMIDADTSLENTVIAKASRHFIDKDVIAVSCGLKVRNAKVNWVTRFQSMEYILGIELGRFGLNAVNSLNNISGAFGIFRRDFIRRIGGWSNGSAEDLDMVMRIQAYQARYPHLKIVAERKAIAYTAVPEKAIELFHQRNRWDGDLFFIYVRRHWRKFNKHLFGRFKSMMIVWYGLYYQLMLPFVVILYYFYIAKIFNLSVVVAATILIWIYYTASGFVMLAVYLAIISRDLKDDIKLAPILLIMPVYQLIIRLCSVYFILNEILFESHKETSMAPWWVLKRRSRK